MTIKTLTTTEELEDFCAQAAAHPYVTIDTEFLRERTYYSKLCLIQLAMPGETDETAVLVDPLSKDLSLEPLYTLFRNEAVVKVFHAARQDLEIFWVDAGVFPTPLFDTQVAAMVCGFGEQVGYETLVRKIAKQGLDKSSRFTDWSRRPLSQKQLDYAIADVTHLRDLYPIMRERLETKKRDAWLAEEMAILTRAETYRLEPEDAWKRLKLRKTHPKWVAGLRAAASWREREAQTRDMPRQRVMKDDALYEIAGVAPVKPDDLAGLRGVPKGFERSKPAERLYEVMKTAMADPEAYAPKVEKPAPPPSGIGPTVELLKVYLKLVAEEAGVASRLIATVPDLEKIAADDKADIPAMHGWRRDVFGEPALRLKKGEISLALEDGKVVAKDLKA